MSKLYRDPPDYNGMGLEGRGRDGFVHYNGLQEYISKNTRVDALSLDKLNYLFLINFAFFTNLLILNLAHYYAKKFIIRRIFARIKRKLRNFVRNGNLSFSFRQVR